MPIRLILLCLTVLNASATLVAGAVRPRLGVTILALGFTTWVLMRLTVALYLSQGGVAAKFESRQSIDP